MRGSLATVGRWMPWCHPEYSIRDSREWVAACQTQWVDGQAFEFGIFDPDSTEVWGGVGINQINRSYNSGNLGFWVRVAACHAGGIPACGHGQRAPNPGSIVFSMRRENPMFKIEVEDGHGLWSDVRGADGAILTFAEEDDARAKLAELFPVIVQMEKFTGGKRTRVIRILKDEDDWPKRPPAK